MIRSLLISALALFTTTHVKAVPPEHLLDVGIAGHAFDHLGDIGDQGEAAAASGATVIYISGCGIWGYDSLPAAEEVARGTSAISDYINRSRKAGIQVVIGYLCATSIVHLDRFDHNWPAALRSQFAHPPSEWLQQDKDGKPLPSWYGGEYRPACMNNPDWRTYEKAMVRRQLEAGCDGIFFDNPTVHPQGCYCQHCMKRFATFLGGDEAKSASVAELRKQALAKPVEFLRFRAMTGREFLAEMRTYARTIKPRALITCNNSLNAPNALFSQDRTYGYDIYEMSKAQDLVVVEDMGTQPRTAAGGAVIEYGPTYELLQGISHGKPVVAVTIAEADYHTPGNLARLAMAEAAAHGASNLWWPTWPEKVRPAMIAALRPEADLLRANTGILNGVKPRADVVLFLPWREWTATGDCRAAKLAAALSAANVQFRVVCEDDLTKTLEASGGSPVLLVESPSVLLAGETKAVEQFKAAGGRLVTGDKADWLAEVQRAVGTPSISLHGPATMRAVVRDQEGKAIVHLLNLNVQRLSSFEDRVTAGQNVEVSVHIPSATVQEVNAISADEAATKGKIPFEVVADGKGAMVTIKLADVQLSTILVIQ